MYWNPLIVLMWSVALGLTLTWDVLKCMIRLIFIIICFRLTLTWDVLKYESVYKIK